jgi:hypothetical protein
MSKTVLTIHDYRCPSVQFSNPKPCDCVDRKTAERRKLLLNDLRVLLAHNRLGEFGMDALKDTLFELLPELYYVATVHD